MLNESFENMLANCAEHEDLSHHYALADELEATGDKKYRPLINNLRENQYSDFNSKKFTAPKMQMYADFQRVGRRDLAKNVVDGKYD